MEPSVTAMVARAAQQFPHEVSTIDVASGRTRTWSETLDRVRRLAGALLARGLQPEDRVAVLALNSDRYFELYFACAWAGGIIVPVNIRLAPPEIAEVLADAEAQFLVIDEAFQSVVPTARAQTPSLRHVLFLGDGVAPEGCLSLEEEASKATQVDDAGRAGNAIFMLMYTGGTTGKAKGVMLSNSNLCINALGHVGALSFSQKSRYLHSAPMFHLANGNGLFTATLVGASHVFIPKFVPADALRAIAAHGVSKAMFVPAMLAIMLQDPVAQQVDCSCLEDIIYGAAPMPSPLLAKAMQTFPRARWHQGYGMSETSPAITMLGPESHAPDHPKLGSVGRPVPWVQVAILDADGREVPRGAVGEICTRGPHVMRGYWRNAARTEEALRGGWMHTEDGGFMDEDGFVFICDRLKDMIVTGGENVYSSEVENAVAKFPGVAMCAVVGTPDEKFGELVTAVVVPAPGVDTIDEKALVQHCRALIANYKVPRKVIVRAALPMSGAGKILKAELRKELNTDAMGRAKNNL